MFEIILICIAICLIVILIIMKASKKMPTEELERWRLSAGFEKNGAPIIRGSKNIDGTWVKFSDVEKLIESN